MPTRSSIRMIAAIGAVSIKFAAVAQSTGISWGPVLDCNAEGEGSLRPRIALNASGDPVVLWGDNAPMANLVAIGNGDAFSASVEVSTGFTPAVADWMGSSIASVGNTVWVVMKSTPEESRPLYVRRSDDGGYTWGDTMRVDPYDGLVSRFPSIDVVDPEAPVVQYMQFDSGWLGARQVVTAMTNGTFATPVQVSSPFASGDVCDCCPNQIIADGGKVVALYRNAGSNVRVLWGASSSDGGSTFPVGAVLDTTGWVFNACPSSGPDGLIDGDSVRYVWMSGANQGTKAYIGSAALSDLSIGVQSRVHAGQPSSLQQNFPRISGSGDTLGVVWPQTSGGQHEILFSWSTTGVNGLSAPDTVNVDLPGAQKTPDIAFSSDAFHIVWSEANTGQVRYRQATLGTEVSVPATADVSARPMLWPNPADDLVHVDPGTTSGPIAISVLDPAGRIVLSEARSASAGPLKLPLTGLADGTYSIVVQANGVRSIGTLVILSGR